MLFPPFTQYEWYHWNDDHEKWSACSHFREKTYLAYTCCRVYALTSTIGQLRHVAKVHAPRSTILRLKLSQILEDTGHASITTYLQQNQKWGEVHKFYHQNFLKVNTLSTRPISIRYYHTVQHLVRVMQLQLSNRDKTRTLPLITLLVLTQEIEVDS